MKSLDKETQHSTDSAKETSSEKNNGNVKDKGDVTKDLDKILADLDLSSENVDNHQQKMVKRVRHRTKLSHTISNKR